MYIYTRKYNYEKNRKIGIILSIICIVFLALRNIEIAINSDGFNPEILPLQICHFANFVLLIAFLRDSKPMFATAFCFNLPCAFLSIVFANSLENYSTILNFRGIAYIFGHMLIVGITIWALLVGFMNLTKKDLYKGIAFVLILFVLSVPINNLLNDLLPQYTANYFYTIKPESGTPLEDMYNLGKVISVVGIEFNLVYIILDLILGSIVFLGFYLAVKGLNRKFDFELQAI
jgi:uncharacterized membrane protein YwaF